MFPKDSRAKANERLLAENAKWLAYQLPEQAEGPEPAEDTSQEAGSQRPAEGDGRFGQKWLCGEFQEEAGQRLRTQFEHTHQFKRETPAREDMDQELDARLSAYYGPALPAQPLPAAAWLSLRERLSPRERRFSRSARHLARSVQVFEHLTRSTRQPVQFDIQQLYATLLLQTNYRRPAPTLRVRRNRRPAAPRVSAGLLGRGQITLLLPRADWSDWRRPEMDVLLAAGLARCGESRRPLTLLPRALFALSLLLVLTLLPFTSIDRRAVWLFLIALTCCLLSGRVLVWQQRLQAFRGDRVAVQWLGRERVCQGLHLLAERGQPTRRPTWGEPSLAERIARVCGTPLEQKDKRLTLVG